MSLKKAILHGKEKRSLLRHAKKHEPSKCENCSDCYYSNCDSNLEGYRHGTKKREANANDTYEDFFPEGGLKERIFESKIYQ